MNSSDIQHIVDIQKYIDHTLLKPTATQQDISCLCKEALEYSFAAVCVHSCFLDFVYQLLYEQWQAQHIQIAVVSGFPLGANASFVKQKEAEYAMQHGATEIDMVVNIGAVKEGNYKKVEQDVRMVKQVMGDAVLKVIIENCYLNDAEKRSTCIAAVAGGADFVKTSTGLGPGGATLHDVKIMKEAIQGQAKIH